MINGSLQLCFVALSWGSSCRFYQGKIKHRHLQLQCCAHGVVHARVSFGCCAAVSVRKVHRCRLTAVGVMCCAACAVLGIQYVLLRHWKRFYN